MWSVGSGKMIGISSLNTDTPSNKFCQGMYNSTKENIICRECYSMSMLKTFRKNCRPKFTNNSKFLSSKIHDREYLPPCPSTTGRFHSHGELINSIHLENILNICLNQPMTTFTLWTKRTNLVKKLMQNRKKPKNLILIYSNPVISKPITKPPLYFDKVFNAVYKEQFIEEQNCTGQKCKDCLKCYNFSNKKKDNIIYEAVKRPPKNKPLRTICEACYSHKGINFRKHTMVKPLEKNSRLLKTKLTEIQIPKILNRFFRFNHHGELLDN